MSLVSDFNTYLRARFTVLWVISFEEERILNVLKSVCCASSPPRPLVSWDVAAGFKAIDTSPTAPAGAPSAGTTPAAPSEVRHSGTLSAALPDARDPRTALDFIGRAEVDQNAVFVLKDFHHCLHNQPVTIRQLRNLAQAMRVTRKAIIITSPISRIPDDLKDDVVPIDFPAPDAEEIGGVLDRLSQNKPPPLVREKLVRSALGLSSNQAQRVIGKAIVAEVRDPSGNVKKKAGVLDEWSIDLITAEKKSIIRESGALEFYAAHETLGSVGGLDLLKHWLRQREEDFTDAARDYGIDAPKGIALVGIPGTGKSLTAKMVSNLWRQPLVRLDVGALFGSLVGQSEENTKRALALVETIAPCLLWIDEMEKMFARGGLDGGASERVFGTILTWMQEKKKPVFVIGTANEILSLPPEFFRAGRFDAVFFLDLPTVAERREIFEVHLAKRKREPKAYDLDALAAAAVDHVGSEIEQAIIDGMHLAYYDPKERHRDFTTQDILAALRAVIPLSRSRREDIDRLRQWVREGRAKAASSPEIQVPVDGSVNLQLS